MIVGNVMDPISILKRFTDWLQRTPAVQFVVWTVTGIIVWKLSATVVQDILIYGAFLFALTRAFRLRQDFGGQSRDMDAWKQPAGIAFVVILIHMILSLPFALHPALSLRDFSGMLKIFAGAFAIPVI